jgi:uncharacterized protein
MTGLQFVPPAPAPWRAFLERHAVAVFSTITVVVTVAILLAPLPAIAGPALVVFIPALVAALLLRLGGGSVRKQLFSRRVWGISARWAAISLGAAVALRLAVSLLGLLAGHPFAPGAFVPFLLAGFLFAAGEEIGWRGFALPRLLASGRSPLVAALMLGVPWALLHLPLVLPGKLSAGTPMAAQFLMMVALSVLTSWAYLASGRSLTAAALLHGGQTLFVFLNDGLGPVASGWLMALAYGGAALLIAVLSKGTLGWRGPDGLRG